MAKTLSQIAFDFSAPEEPVKTTEAAPLPEAVNNVPLPVILQEEEEADMSAPVLKKTIASKPLKKETSVTATGKKRGRRSLKEAAASSDLIQVPDDELLYKKQYYSIGEVAQMFRENQSLIRFWETEFDILQPRKNRKGDRFFRPIDIKNLVLIHDLLRRRKFTIEGAREYLKKNNAQSIPGKADEKFELIQSLQRIRSFLLELKASL